jgi:hypothetical protein
MGINRVFTGCLISFSCCVAWAFADYARGDDEGVIARIPLEFSTVGLCIPVDVGDRTIKCLLDPKVNLMFVDETLRPLLGDKIGQDFPAGHDVHASPQIALGGITCQATGVVCARLAEGLRDHVQGVIGSDVLANKTIRLDLNNNSLEILSPLKLDARTLGEPIHFHLNQFGSIVLPVQLMDMDAQNFVVDLQDPFSGSVRGNDLDNLIESGEGVPVGIAYDGAANEVALMTRISHLSIGPLRRRNIVLRKSSHSVGTLGRMLFEPYLVVIDFPGRVMYFKDQGVAEYVDRSDASGILLAQSPATHAVFVAAVLHESEAARNGIRRGDIVEAINGKPPTDERIHFLRTRADVILKLRRGQFTFEQRVNTSGIGD